MADIASLAVSLTAHTDRFRRGMLGAVAPLRVFQGAIDSANARFAAFSGSLVGGLTLAGLATFTKRSGDAIAQLGIMSDRLDISTEALNAFKLGAKKSNIEFSTLTGGLEFFNRNLAKVAAGSDEAGKIFDAIGLDKNQIVGMGAEDALATVADRINGLANANDRLLASSMLFGKGAGGDFLTFLRDGSAGLDRMIQRSAELGGAFSRIDAQVIDNANSKLDEMGALLTNVAATLAGELAPYLDAATTKMVALGESGTKTGDMILGFVEKSAKGLSYLVDGWQVLELAINTAQITILTGVLIISKTFDELQLALDKIAAKIPYFADKIKPGRVLEGFNEALIGQMTELGKKQRELLDEPWAHNKVDDYFKNLREKAVEAAQAQISGNQAVGQSLDDVFAKQRKTQQIGDFKQLTIRDALSLGNNLIRGTDIGSLQASGVSSLGREQRVTDPQLQTANKWLERIAQNTEDNVAVAG